MLVQQGDERRHGVPDLLDEGSGRLERARHSGAHRRRKPGLRRAERDRPAAGGGRASSGWPGGSASSTRTGGCWTCPRARRTEPMPTGLPYSATEEQRRLVRAMAGYGVPHEGIAIMLDIDPKTLRRHYRHELDRGSVEATAKVAQSLFQMATVDKNVAAAIFWMKARAGWREKHEVQVTTRTAREFSDAELLRIIEHHRDDIEAEKDEPAPALEVAASPEPVEDQ